MIDCQDSLPLTARYENVRILEEHRLEFPRIKRSDFIAFIYLGPIVALPMQGVPGAQSSALRILDITFLHKHLRNAHYRPKTLTHTTAHTRECRAAGKITGATSGVVSLRRSPLAPSEIFQAPR